MAAHRTHCSHCDRPLDLQRDTVSLGVCALCQRDVEDRTNRRGRYAPGPAPALRASWRPSPSLSPLPRDVVRRHNTHHAHIRVASCRACALAGNAWIDVRGPR